MRRTRTVSDRFAEQLQVHLERQSNPDRVGCPTFAALEAFFQGKLRAGTLEQVTSHLVICKQCLLELRTIRDISGEESINTSHGFISWDRVRALMLHPAVAYLIVLALIYPAYRGLFVKSSEVRRAAPEEKVTLSLGTKRPEVPVASLPPATKAEENRVTRSPRRGSSAPSASRTASRSITNATPSADLARQQEAVGDLETTRSPKSGPSGVALRAVRRIYVGSFGDDALSQQVRGALVGALHQNRRFVLAQSHEDADALIEGSVTEGGAGGTTAVRLINAAGDVLWTTSQRSSATTDRGFAADVSAKIVRNLLDAVHQAQRLQTTAREPR